MEEGDVTRPGEQFIGIEEKEYCQAFSDLRNSRLAEFCDIENCFDS